MTPEQSFVETWVMPYFWELMAVIVMPFLAFRVTQFIKRSYKRVMGGASIHWLFLQMMTFCTAWVTADYCLENKYDEATSILLSRVGNGHSIRANGSQRDHVWHVSCFVWYGGS